MLTKHLAIIMNKTIDYEIHPNDSLEQWEGHKFPPRISFYFYSPKRCKWIKVYMDIWIAKQVGFYKNTTADKLFIRAKELGFKYIIKHYQKDNEYCIFYREGD